MLPDSWFNKMIQVVQSIASRGVGVGRVPKSYTSDGGPQTHECQWNEPKSWLLNIVTVYLWNCVCMLWLEEASSFIPFFWGWEYPWRINSQLRIGHRDDSAGLLHLCCCYLVTKLCLTLLWPRGLQPAKFLCPEDFLDKNTRVGCHFLLQGIFPTQGWNPHLLHWPVDSLPLSHMGALTLRLGCEQLGPVLSTVPPAPAPCLFPWKGITYIKHGIAQGPSYAAKTQVCRHWPPLSPW